MAICIITVAELYYGAYHSQKIEQNLIAAERFTSEISILHLDIPTLKVYGRLKSQLRKAGTPLADFDLLIASVAITSNRILVTNNMRHFQRIPDLQVQTWVE